MTTEPTDAELKAMWQLHAADIGGIFCYARAVLAKWGTPAPVGVEPVAWKHDCAALLTNDVELWIDACPHCGKPRNAPQPVEREPVARLKIGKTKGGVSLTHIAEPAAFQLPEGMYALYTAPQPVEREPLTDAQIKGLIEEGVFFGNCKEIVRAIEAAHGIKKGGQHGTE